MAELLPGPRAAMEPAGDGPNSPWFDTRRARAVGAADSVDSADSADSADGRETPDTPQDSATAPSSGTAVELRVEPVLRMFPWFVRMESTD